MNVIATLLLQKLFQSECIIQDNWLVMDSKSDEEALSANSVMKSEIPGRSLNCIENVLRKWEKKQDTVSKKIEKEAFNQFKNKVTTL